MLKRRGQTARAIQSPVDANGARKAKTARAPGERLWEQVSRGLLMDERSVCGILLERSPTSDHELARLRARTRALAQSGGVASPLERTRTSLRTARSVSTGDADEILRVTLTAAGLDTVDAVDAFIAARAAELGRDVRWLRDHVQAAREIAKEALWSADTISSVLSMLMRDGDAWPATHVSIAAPIERTEASAEQAVEVIIEAIRGLGRGAGPSRSRHRGGVFARPSLSFELAAVTRRLRAVPTAEDLRDIADLLGDIVQVACEEDVLVFLAAPREADLHAVLVVYADVLRRPVFQRWDGLGLTISSASRRAIPVLRLLRWLADDRGAALPVRLAHARTWSADLMWAIADGLADYPVLTSPRRRSAQFVACARAILSETNHFHGFFVPETAAERAAVEVFGHARAYDLLLDRFALAHARTHDLEPTSDERLRVDLAVGSQAACLAAWRDRVSEERLRAQLLQPPSAPADECDAVAEPQAAYTDDPIAQLARDFEAAAGGGLSDWLRAPTHVDGDWYLSPRRPFGEPAQDQDPPSPDAARGADPIIELVSDEMPQDDEEVRVGAPDVAGARAVQAEWVATSLSDRLRIVRQWAHALDGERAELVARLVRDCGLTIRDAEAEVWHGVETARTVARLAEARAADCDGRARLGLTDASVGARPRGVVGVLPERSRPIANVVTPICYALIGGNAAIIAPARTTKALVNVLLGELVNAGVQEGLVTALDGPDASSDIGDATVAMRELQMAPDIDALYVGGARARLAAVSVQRAQARLPLIPVVGPARETTAAVVDGTVALDHAADAIVASVVAFAGQGPEALRSVIAPADVARRLCALLADRFEKTRIGRPDRVETQLGPLVDAKARDAAIAEKARLIAEAALIYDGSVPGDLVAEPYVAPMVVRTEPDLPMRIQADGPMIAVTAATDQAALTSAIAQLAPLTHLAVFSADQHLVDVLAWAGRAVAVARDGAPFGPSGGQAHCVATGAYTPGLRPIALDLASGLDLFTIAAHDYRPVV